MQLGFFYPENGERTLPSISFSSVEEAKAWVSERMSRWQAISATGDDKSAWMNNMSGSIIVLREVKL